MKHKILSLIMLPALLLAGCEKEKPTDEVILAGREVRDISVSYSMDGAAVSSLSFGHNAASREIDVVLNDDGLRWNLESNREWLKVVSDPNRGSGKVSLQVAANESFDARDEATLTFVAGEFRGFALTASQAASSFVVGQPFAISPKDGLTFSTKVTTKSGTSWDVTSEDWITVSRGTAVSSNGMQTEPLSITVMPDGGNSRFGRVTLSAGSDKEYINVFQFGTEHKYDSAGNLVLPGSGSKLEITVPRYLVADVELPAFAEYSISDSDSDLATLTLTFADNLSDCSETRSIAASLLLSNSSASVVPLPGIVQDYIPAHGLVTAKGLKAFADAVASGSSTADWENNGVVVVVEDIDMAGVEGWTGIGTEDKPYTGTFDGKGHSVINLTKTRSGIFNVCKGATISNVTLGKGCSIYNDIQEYNKGAWVGGIANKATATAFSGCSMTGSVEYAGISNDDSGSFAGGIVGWCDSSSSILNCKMSGKLTVSAGSDADVTVNAGGIAGLNAGRTAFCEMSGTMGFSSGIGHARLGGIMGSLIEGATVENNAYMGTITLNGTPMHVAIGGLYGVLDSSRSFDNASDKSVSLGTIKLSAFANTTETRIFAGGFAGMASNGINVAFKGYEFQTNISFDQTAARVADFLLIGGVLGGSDPDAKLAGATFDSISNQGIYSTEYTTTATPQVRHAYIGGIAGFINGPATFTKCVNNAEIGKITSSAVNCANTKNYAFILGGIAGVVIGGDATFTGCENKAKITNNHYSNVIPGGATSGWYTACSASGILGAFDCVQESVSGKLVMKDCANGAVIASYRGCSAGMVCFARNAEISSCSNLGDMSVTNSNAANKGGIACTLEKSTITGCIVKCNVFCSNPASAVQCPGGILSNSQGGGVTISDCSWFGVISVNKVDQPFNCGGIVATAEEDTVVRNCKIGGTINGVVLSENNIGGYAVGNKTGKVEGLSYWPGN